jgi:hypothetical protein
MRPVASFFAFLLTVSLVQAQVQVKVKVTDPKGVVVIDNRLGAMAYTGGDETIVLQLKDDVVLPAGKIRVTLDGVEKEIGEISITMKSVSPISDTPVPLPCVPGSLYQTDPCPAGQVGQIMKHKISICPGPVWSDWIVDSNTCAVPTPGLTKPVSPFPHTWWAPKPSSKNELAMYCDGYYECQNWTDWLREHPEDLDWAWQEYRAINK